MKIKKKEPSVGVVGKVLNLFSGSSKDTYSCEYLNDKFENIDISGAVGGDTLPIGSMLPYGNATPPENWLVCDGSAVSRTVYKELFEVIGTSYGAGDGSTTFNLPNKKGKVSVGLDSSDSDFNTIGKTGGEKKHTLTINEMPSHNHITKWDGGNQTESSSVITWKGGSTNWQNVATLNTGGSQPHNNLQPYQVDNWIIKAFQSSAVTAQVNNNESDSTTDTYSCDYINSNIAKIVEAGKNDNGTYVKYDNGYMECSHTMTTDSQNTSSHYQSGTWTYPATFVITPDVIATPCNWNTNAYFVKVNPKVGNSQVMQQVLGTSSGEIVDKVGDKVCLKASGWWKLPEE